MRDGKITVEQVGDILITMARTAPIQTTIIAKKINDDIIETLSALKLAESNLTGTSPTIPRDSPTVLNY